MERNQTLSAEQHSPLGLGPLESSFPGQVFPSAAVHQLISNTYENASCTSGFISVLLGKLMRQNAFCIWISTRRVIFPPALIHFGIEPERILFVDTNKAKDALWAIEESLKCSALSAVVGEIGDLSFNESRRLQLAVEQSRVTGLIHCYQPRTQNAVACVSRWKITPLAGIAPDNMPGLGFPVWRVELLKVRNGKPHYWEVQWSPNGLEVIGPATTISQPVYERETA